MLKKLFFIIFVFTACAAHSTPANDVITQNINELPYEERLALMQEDMMLKCMIAETIETSFLRPLQYIIKNNQGTTEKEIQQKNVALAMVALLTNKTMFVHHIIEGTIVSSAYNIIHGIKSSYNLTGEEQTYCFVLQKICNHILTSSKNSEDARNWILRVMLSNPYDHYYLDHSDVDAFMENASIQESMQPYWIALRDELKSEARTLLKPREK